MTYDFLVVQARKEDINLPSVWIRISQECNEFKKSPIKIEYKGKNCYVQCRTVDQTLISHTSYQNIVYLYKNENIIFISEHYREILGIKEEVIKSFDFYGPYEEKKFDGKRCALDIAFPKAHSCRYYWYSFMAAWQHPDIYAKVSICLGVLSFLIAIVGILQNIGLQKIVKLLPIGIRDICLFGIGVLFSCIASIFFSEKNIVLLISIIALILLIIA